MSTKALNVVISKEDLDQVISRASLAAMSEEGQSGLSRASNETKGCIRISAHGGKIIFDSAVSRFSSRYVVTAGAGDAAIISEGETCVPASALKTVAGKVRKGRKVSMVFIATPHDPTLKISPTDKATQSEGVIEIGSMNGDRVVAKSKIEAYPAVNFSVQQYPEASDLTLLMSGKASSVKGPCNIVGFCINPEDHKEIYDKYAIFTAPDSVFFLGSDGKRCAVVQAKADTFDKMLGAETKAPILIDIEYMGPVMSSLSDDEPISVSVDNEGLRIYIQSASTIYCINMIAETMRMKYPSYKRVISLQAGAVALVNRDDLAEILDMMNSASKERGRHTYDEKTQFVNLIGQGVNVIKEAGGCAGLKFVSECKLKGKTINLGTAFLVEGLKKMTSENVRMTFTPDELRTKVEDETDPKFVYYLQVMNPNEV